jgi:hypothetical protein
MQTEHEHHQPRKNGHAYEHELEHEHENGHGNGHGPGVVFKNKYNQYKAFFVLYLLNFLSKVSL